MKFLLITEANKKVATGHFIESCEIVDEIQRRGHEVFLALNSECPLELIDRIHCSFFYYGKSIKDNMELTVNKIKSIKPDTIITDLREIENKDINYIKESVDCKLVCIDEFGNRRLDADIIINPMVDMKFWEYPDTTSKIYAGHQYLALPKRIAQYHEKEKLVRRTIGRICIAMGGVDYYATTIKLVEWMPSIFETVKVDCIIGGGFRYKEELNHVLNKIPSRIDVRVMQNISNIYDYFYDADVGFCAGGNTLHELACIGTPSIVIPTMAHEYNNGKAFEKHGAVRCLNRAEIIDYKSVDVCVKEFSYEARKNMSMCGKKFAEGNGVNATVDICVKSIDER